MDGAPQSLSETRSMNDAPRRSPVTISFGRYPTPVQRLSTLATDCADLWVKRDDLTSLEYGGNKVRKLERLLAHAVAGGARRVVTVGAAGSHHVLATTIFGRKVGLEVEAVLVPQPRTDHVVDVLRAGLARGLRPWPVRSWAAVPFAVAARMGPGTAFLPVGGSNLRGSMGYVDAARELAAQVRAGELPEPDVCVVALGSGGTAAGLVAGFLAEGLATRVVGVCVAAPTWLVRTAAWRLVAACVREVAAPGSRRRESFSIDERFLGRGYGHPTSEGQSATRAAAGEGLVLDPTYTAKAFAAALWHVRARRSPRVLYWHTLSSAPMAPLLEGAPAVLGPPLARLMMGAEGRPPPL
jgi:1-aminocyclopropane-1-carboxylate deaminase/D-cysteine desulfhydrase-like pyridoxal-dependent ACC family enzyme